MIHIEQITPELTWRLRRDVLYPNQKIFEMELDEDMDGIHFGAFKNDKLVGIVSLFQKGTDFQFRKLALSRQLKKWELGTPYCNTLQLTQKKTGGQGFGATPGYLLSIFI